MKILSFIIIVSAFTSCVAPPSAEPVKSYYGSDSVAAPKPYVIKGVTYYPLSSVSPDYEETGIASWYGKDFHNKKTAGGEKFDMYAFTAAHKTLPMPTYISVVNLENNKSVVVKVNDRGPFSKGRILDLSYAAAEQLGMVAAGTARVRITVLSEASDRLRTESRNVDINSGSFGVQLASFSVRANARDLSAKIKNSRISEVTVNGKRYYRVQVFGYNTKQEAETAAKRFEKEYEGAFVIAK
ncbi:MAG: septal ring lytic transglycosylase RlpA family protein [Deferribacteraceae bacterium]|nr:septal ring lytic transglycosylase RlpA family protein [Deferribacteraceae bacterium]